MTDDNTPMLTPLKGFGEFNVIDRLTRDISIKRSSTVKGIGDDAAVIAVEDKYMVVSTDMLIESIHFDLGYVPLTHLGYKAVVTNLSDIYAMNATPTHITVSFAASNRFTLEAMEDLYMGIEMASTLYNVDVVGGDTTSAALGMQISITAIGEVEKDRVVYRSGAKPGDLLVVTGELGGAYIGLKALQRERELFKVNLGQSNLKDYIYSVGRQLKPEAREDVIAIFKEAGIKPSAMIDISDGLSSETTHLCNASKTGCVLYEEKLPINPEVIATADQFQLDLATVILNGGEDYELLFTMGEEDYNTIKDDPNFTVIGQMTGQEEGLHFMTRTGEKKVLEAMGWNAMRPPKKR